MPFSLKQLQHLLLLADERHFARAADRAALSQSAFSRSIQTLESVVGARLFDRDLKHVVPTPLGECLIERARTLLADSHDIQRELLLLRSGDLGHVAMGAGAFAGAVVLPGPMARLRQAHPGVRVDVDVIESSTLLDQLLRDDLDFYVGEYSTAPAQADLVIEPLGRLLIGVYCRADHPLAGRSRVGLMDLADFRLASVHIPDVVLRDLSERLTGGRGVLPELSLQCGSLTILRDYVLESDAVLLGVQQPFRLEIEQGLLVQLRVQAADGTDISSVASADLGLAYLAKRTPTPASQLLMDMIREECKVLLAPGVATRPPGRSVRRRP